MAENKGKTKAAILHELESIKGLLLEDDEIPILQEAIDDEPAFEHPLPKRDLDELHDVFQALSHNIRNASEKIGSHATPSASPSAGLTRSAFTQESGKNLSTKLGVAEKQGSLFGETKPDKAATATNYDYLDEAIMDLTDDDVSAEASGATREVREFNQTLNYAVSKSITPPPRPALAKASGENPFLPQHIRARLHGNNPPPLFDGVAEKVPLPTASKPAAEPVSRQQLIRDVVAAVLPEVEQELRQRLQTLTEEQLQDILKSRD